MPYQIVKADHGYFVMSPEGKTFSKKPLSKTRAIKQRVAIALSEARKKHMPPSTFF